MLPMKCFIDFGEFTKLALDECPIFLTDAFVFPAPDLVQVRPTGVSGSGTCRTRCVLEHVGENGWTVTFCRA